MSDVMQEIGPGSLTYTERDLLEKLDEMSPPVYRRQLRDAKRAEDVVQAAGLATVGRPDTRMALAFRDFANLAKKGYVERVKDEEGGSGQIKYRITQLAEREILTRKMLAAQRDLDGVEQKRRIAAGDARVWKGAALAAREVLSEIAAVGWWRRGRARRIAAAHLEEAEAGQIFVADSP